MRIAFGDLQVSEESKKHIKGCLETSRISGGKIVKALEDSWGSLFDYKYNVAMTSGTGADMAALMTL